MKKIFCFVLTFVLLFNSTYCIYADDISAQALIDVDTDKLKNLSPEDLEPASLKFLELIGLGVDPAKAILTKEVNDAILQILGKDGAMKKDDEGNIYVMQSAVDEINKAVQDKVHALDGYFLCVPEHSFSEFPYAEMVKQIADVNNFKLPANAESLLRSKMEKICHGNTFFTKYYYDGNMRRFHELPYSINVSADNLYIVQDGWTVYKADSSGNLTVNTRDYVMPIIKWDSSLQDFKYSSGPASSTYHHAQNVVSSIRALTYAYGDPIRVFYSLKDLKKFLNNGKQRTYAPKLPNVTIKIPVKYINNSVSLPDITYNITTENKTETEIQNQYDITIKNYLDNLNDFSDGTTPTPTPKPDGGFTDGTTPTPTPAIGDGSDDSGNSGEVIDLLKKILDKLTSFADSHLKFEKTITDYIEANDGKLDQIIEAINALSDGKTEDEKNGCKYDFTALSDFMTKLWNESDKKFDKMVELLEENNKYQKKLVNSLNEIKAILVTQTIMDVFQDRSQQTAEKAKDKFPTSLPWDIALVVNAMSAEPEKPQFNLPIQIKSLNINEEIHVDLASGEWEKLAKTCRYLLSVLFILLMIQLSRKLFSNGGDD